MFRASGRPTSTSAPTALCIPVAAVAGLFDQVAAVDLVEHAASVYGLDVPTVIDVSLS